MPNELVQQQAGQRQDIVNQETSGQVFFQHTISPDLFLSLSGSVRDAGADLTSNPLSTPVIISQSRGYREGYARADLSGHKGRHSWKTGIDSFFTPVHETLAYTITDPSQFDPVLSSNFNSPTAMGYRTLRILQDEVHLRNWNISAGLRFDHYAFVVHNRPGATRRCLSLCTLIESVTACFLDRVFQTPAMENLLLASSPQLNSLDSLVYGCLFVPREPTTTRWVYQVCLR